MASQSLKEVTSLKFQNMASESSRAHGEILDADLPERDENGIVIGAEEMTGPPELDEAQNEVGEKLTAFIQAEGGAPATLPERYAISISRHPRKHLLASLVVVCAASAIGMTMGNFYVRADAAGWWSRSTLIADRATQERVIYLYGEELRRNDTLWDRLTSTELTNWQNVNKDLDEIGRQETVCNGTWYGSEFMTSPHELNLVSMWRTSDAESPSPVRSAIEAEALYDLCIAEQNTLQLLEEKDLCIKCPTAESNGLPIKCMQPYSLVVMARHHISYLEGDFDFGADGSIQVTPHFFTPDISCEYLRDHWFRPVANSFIHILKECAQFATELVEGNLNPDGDSTECPSPLFIPSVLDTKFSESDPPLIRYTSSIYATKNDDASIKALYDLSRSKAFHTSVGNGLEGLYDSGINSIYTTRRMGFYTRYMNQIMVKDIGLSVASGFVTTLCILLHTRSPFLTIMGLLQIMLSFPLAYFVYYFICGLEFFPFLNFNAIFVVFSLGADDIFVAVDKWKNARIELHDRPIEEVAALALPNAAYCMFVTSATTAVAFFGTSVISVPAIECFGIFCGLVVTMDYFLNILLVFPSLCLYDQWVINGSKNLLVSLDAHRKRDGQPIKSIVAMTTANTNSVAIVTSQDCESKRNHDGVEQEYAEVLPEPQDFNIDGTIKAEQDIFFHEGSQKNHDASHVLIHSVLDKYYGILHKFRWPLLAMCIGATASCGYVTTKLKPTNQANPPFLPSSNPYEIHRTWSENLLSSVLFKGGFGKLFAIWGVTPADTGYRLNPDKWTRLVLDDDFDPTSKLAQYYLLDFCNGLFENRFTRKVTNDYICPMNAFDAWLKEQSNSESPVAEYQNNCNGTSSVPVPPEVFDQCIISWSEYADVSGIYQHEGKVKIMTVSAITNTTYESSYMEQRKEFLALEDWRRNEASIAPEGVNRFFFTSYDFWWYDTLHNMMGSTYKSAGIAIACASIMVFLTSQSIKMMIFSGISIAYVIFGATASLVGMGWTLGLFESILFAILVGIGCDFVIHMSHAYIMHPGNVSRHDRTRFALLHMGPSVLASWATTIMTALIMMFTELTYFRKFSLMLSMTMVHSFIGSFFVLMALCDCIGPSDPHYFFGSIKSNCKTFWKR